MVAGQLCILSADPRQRSARCVAALVRNEPEHRSSGVTCTAVSAALAQLQMQHGLVITTAGHKGSRQQLMLCWFLGEQSADLLTKQAFILRQDAMREIRPGHTHEAPGELQLTDSGGSRVSWRHQSKAHRAKGYACVFLPCFYL